MEVNVNERIKLLRTQLSLSVDEFAIKCNINRATVYRMESGESDVKQKTIKSIATALGVNTNWLLTGKGKMFVEADKTKNSLSN